jgi:hypothetical protein
MDEQLMLDPAARRRWLLAKALEIAPLSQALALAQEAESFLSGMTEGSTQRTFGNIARAATLSAEPEAAATEQRSPSALAVTNARQMVGAKALACLSSLASIDDVMVYLERSGKVFAEDESADELLARANLKRVQEGLPPFALLPGAPTKAAVQDKPRRTEKATPPRPPTARERAEWARQVVALSAD